MVARSDTTTRVHRQVDCETWSLSASLGNRIDRLHYVPTAPELLASVVAEAELAARDAKLKVRWLDSRERPGFGRINCLVPLSEQTFDQLFNGRSGYRAQYYLSPEEGVLFNHSLLIGLARAISEAYQRRSLPATWDLARQSLLSPHSKVWVFGEQEAFDEAIADSLNPPRWVKSKATRGRKAPLPAHLTLDVKGAFLDPESRELFVDDMKLDRPYELFMRGYT